MRDASFRVRLRAKKPELIKGMAQFLGDRLRFLLRRLCAGGNHDEIARAKPLLLDHGAQPLTENALDTVARNGTADLFGYGETDTVDLCLLRVLTAKRLRSEIGQYVDRQRGSYRALTL